MKIIAYAALALTFAAGTLGITHTAQAHDSNHHRGKKGGYHHQNHKNERPKKVVIIYKNYAPSPVIYYGPRRGPAFSLGYIFGSQTKNHDHRYKKRDYGYRDHGHGHEKHHHGKRHH